MYPISMSEQEKMELKALMNKTFPKKIKEAKRPICFIFRILIDFD